MKDIFVPTARHFSHVHRSVYNQFSELPVLTDCLLLPFLPFVGEGRRCDQQQKQRWVDGAIARIPRFLLLVAPVGYWLFLADQVETLSSFYLKNMINGLSVLTQATWKDWFSPKPRLPGPPCCSCDLWKVNLWQEKLCVCFLFFFFVLMEVRFRANNRRDTSQV